MASSNYEAGAGILLHRLISDEKNDSICYIKIFLARVIRNRLTTDGYPNSNLKWLIPVLPRYERT